MGRPRILDEGIMRKIAKKLGKRDLPPINKMVSAQARRLGVSAEASLILLAKEHGIGTATYQRGLDPTKQAEARNALPSVFVAPPRAASQAAKGGVRRVALSSKAQLKLAIEYLITDSELRARCADILMAPGKFDRPINQATLVLEDRIRKKAQPTQKLVGENLVGFAFNEDLSKTVLRVASNNSEDQRGFTQMLRGIVPAFRNSTHHHIIDSFSREEAMRVCGFIDVLLRVVDTAVKVK